MIRMGIDPWDRKIAILDGTKQDYKVEIWEYKGPRPGWAEEFYAACVSFREQHKPDVIVLNETGPVGVEFKRVLKLKNWKFNTWIYTLREDQQMIAKKKAFPHRSGFGNGVERQKD